jgi:hypothetical protein
MQPQGHVQVMANLIDFEMDSQVRSCLPVACLVSSPVRTDRRRPWTSHGTVLLEMESCIWMMVRCHFAVWW